MKDKRKVILNMTFTYQDKSYDIAETIKLRNDLEKTGTAYAWISGLTIDPTNATLQQGKIQQFRYHLSGDAEAVAEGVTGVWPMLPEQPARVPSIRTAF